MATIAIGRTHGQAVMLPRQSRDTHMQVIGSSGSGKSYFLEHMVRRDIVAGRGVCVIDPHGELYDNLINWMIRSDIRTHQLHLMNLSDSKNAVGFNPLCVEDRSPMRRVSDMITAFERVWGSDMGETPRLSKCLRMTLYPLAVHKLSLLEANIFTSYGNRELRKPLIEALPDTYEGNAVRDEWEEFDHYGAREFREYFESTRTRIFEFISAPSVAPVIGQTKNVISFKKCMDAGHIVLVNLKADNDVHKKEAQVLGSLVTADMYASARQRDVKKAKTEPFYAYIDECGDYINEDIAKALDETRKFGLHYILSHQRLNQLRNVSQDTYDAVAVNAQTKVIFRVDEDETAEILAKQLFRSSFDLEIPKEIMNRPVAIGQEIINLYGSSTTEGHVENWGESEGTSAGDSAATSVFVPIDDAERGVTNIDGLTSGNSTGSNHSVSQVSTYSESTSQSLRTVYEVMPTVLYSIEEQMHLAITAIRNLPTRTAFVKLAGMVPIRMETIDVNQREPMRLQATRFIQKAHEKSQFSLPTLKVAEQAKQRKEDFFGFSPIDEDYDPDSFME